MPLIPYGKHTPQIAAGVFVAPGAWITGDVVLEADVSVFFGVVIRGDILPVRVGEGTNIQEHSMLHTSHDQVPCIVGKQVTIGHRALIHGCTVEDGALIGMGSTILDNAVVGKESLIGAQCLVPENMKIPPRSLVVGVPGKIVREITDEDLKIMRQNAEHYIGVGQKYRDYFLNNPMTEVL